MDLRELLNGYVWGRSGRLEDLELEVLHRRTARRGKRRPKAAVGSLPAPGDMRWVRGADVVAVEARGIVVAEAGGPEGGPTSVIPYHRILAVLERGRVLWRREARGPGARP